ncbi:MAG: PRC-barrel domain containing protein [Synechococcus sp. SB0666_bin_14]|nr:PRC-barrel domain containing protein [Synechococcus sp. SB0666_bin_14]MYA91286.1 PRC-barrel domain containing protein [Synechococcus sp. SB0663_bin_10]MYG47092.1 PRC-barrel domain containing protein [Synechococcus sp. SB0675_bin_6]MYJ59002.1 PRC-barrel domain containing protein [Synechococcus sp. SB0672_bin_6]MYK91954.1 PRC-barrel domain containing protein [Synechococcus sp. SB0669_bin_8]
MGTQVIAKDSGRRLGLVGEMVVDVDRREVVALGLRDNALTRLLPGVPRWMLLREIRQVGDVVLVDSCDAVAEDFNPERYSRVINCQVITESGEQLGRVLGFSFDVETGELVTLLIAALGVPVLANGVLSTWELGAAEVVSSGPDRIIVYEGAEEKLQQVSSGLLEKLGIGGESWERQEQQHTYGAAVPVENQLAPGQPDQEEQRQQEMLRGDVTSNQAAQGPYDDMEPELEYVDAERGRRTTTSRRLYLSDDGPAPPRQPANPYWEEETSTPEMGGHHRRHAQPMEEVADPWQDDV